MENVIALVSRGRELGVCQVLAAVAAQGDFAFQVLNNGHGEINAGEAGDAGQAAGAEDVNLHELVLDDVQADEEHAVAHELGTNGFGQ